MSGCAAKVTERFSDQVLIDAEALYLEITRHLTLIGSVSCCSGFWEGNSTTRVLRWYQ
jgi:hypothetical protein